VRLEQAHLPRHAVDPHEREDATPERLRDERLRELPCGGRRPSSGQILNAPGVTPDPGGKDQAMDQPEPAPPPVPPLPPATEPDREHDRDVDEVIRWLRLLGGRSERRPH
jgi:hypothetical protein